MIHMVATTTLLRLRGLAAHRPRSPNQETDRRSQADIAITTRKLSDADGIAGDLPVT